ncbi:MAG: IS1595 family transposase [Planctomycetaceae bacterium]
MASSSDEARSVEADETYVGGKPRYKGNNKRGRGTKKTPVFAAVERGGNVRMQVMQRLTEKDLRRVLEVHVDDRTRLITDELSTYKPIGVRFSGGHHTVTHSAKEYVSKENPEIHSNTSESVFALVKRSVYGTFHSVSKKHLPRYLSEIEFRWNHRKMSDAERTAVAVRKAEGKRLVYRAEDVPATISGWDGPVELLADGSCRPLRAGRRRDGGRCKEAGAEGSP